MMLLWLTSRTALLLYTLPALTAIIILYVQSGHAYIPLGRILPLAVAAVALSFFLTPSGSVTSPTLKTLAEDIRQRVYDYFFFTEPRNVFSGNGRILSPGTQPAGRRRRSHRHPVMQVQTPSACCCAGRS